MDNLSSHSRKGLVGRFGEKIGGILWQRFTVHYAPKRGSRLNQAEIDCDGSSLFVVSLYEIGRQVFVFLKSFALRASRLRRAGGSPGAKKN